MWSGWTDQDRDIMSTGEGSSCIGLPKVELRAIIIAVPQRSILEVLTAFQPPRCAR